MKSIYSNKIVIVAGGASGMGEHLVRQLAPTAKTVIILDRNNHAGRQLAGHISDNVLFESIDMAHADKVTHVLRRIDKEHGGIDFFFNTTGSFMGGEMRDTPLENWHKIVETNIPPIINGTIAIYEIMQKNGHGHIINFASSAGLFPAPVMSIYGATKHAVVGLTLGLRMEAKSFGIKVSVVCPTIVQTPLYDTALYNGLDKTKALDLLKNKTKIQQPDKAARRIIKATAKNKAIIHTSASTHLAWVIYRISPEIYMKVAARIFPSFRKKLRLP